ncbi:MAG TPA: DUF2846 domain-containing protein [Candidatus Acidoferrum sp.]|nr:DUF2846 domain-containing protein [Candidatus Acidoferrum sp.]
MRKMLIVLGLMFALAAAIPATSVKAQGIPPAQAPPADTAAAPSHPATADSDKAKDATIVFFREGHFTGSALKPSIYVDGKEADRLANGRWFSVHTEPGKHQLQSSAKNEPATVIETVAGQTTYVQMVILTGTWRGGGRLLQVDPADAQKIIAKLKPLRD